MADLIPILMGIPLDPWDPILPIPMHISTATGPTILHFNDAIYILNSTISPQATRRLRHANDVRGFHPLINWLADDYKYEVSMWEEKVSNKISLSTLFDDFVRPLRTVSYTVKSMLQLVITLLFAETCQLG